MKAMTLRQPWAHAIAHLGKDVENRTQGFTAKHRGALAIHAGFGWSDLGAERTGLTPGDGLARGAIVAVVDVVDTHDATTRDGAGCHPPAMCSPWAIERDVNDGLCRHLVLENVRALVQPVPASGLLGLWNLPDDVEDAVRAQLELERVPA